jgi:Ca2+:H+ antiporter
MKFLLFFVPLTIVFQQIDGMPAALTFSAAAAAIVSLAKLLVDSTEQLSFRMGETKGALLNATFGNAPELIISLMALNAGLLDVVKASLIGVVLGNLLFVLGLAFFLGGLKYSVQTYNRYGARVQRSELMVAAIGIVIPSVFHDIAPPGISDSESGLNSSLAIVLLTIYFLSLFFSLKTHPYYFSNNHSSDEHEGTAPWSLVAALAVLAASSVLLAWMSHILVGSIEETAVDLSMPRTFIGVIIIALIGGVPESVAAVTMARKDKLDLAMGIAIGSTIQIALFVAPILILSSHYIAPRPLDLVVGNAGIMIVLFPVLLISLVISDGRSHWFKGAQLLSVYILIALFCWFLPDTPDGRFILPK